LGTGGAFALVGADSEDDGIKIGHAGEGLTRNVPVLEGLGQFGLPPFALVKKANSGIGPVPLGQFEQLAQGGQSSGGHDFGLGRRHRFDPADHDPGRR